MHDPPEAVYDRRKLRIPTTEHTPLFLTTCLRERRPEWAACGTSLREGPRQKPPPPDVSGVGRFPLSTQRWSKLRKFARPVLVGVVVVLSQLDWRAALVLSVAVVIVLGLPVITGYWMPGTPTWPGTGPRSSGGAGTPRTRSRSRS